MQLETLGKVKQTLHVKSFQWSYFTIAQTCLERRTLLYENRDMFVFLLCYQGGSRYDDWALKKECNIVETLLEFPSVQATADLLLTQLPALQPVSLP